jgi:hypothetical protein
MTTPLAKVLCPILKLIKDELKRRDNEHIQQHGVKRCFFVDSFEEVTTWLRVLERPASDALRCMNTYDFATIYTTLDQGDIANSLLFAVREAFQGNGSPEAKKHLYIVYKNTRVPAKWHDDIDESNTGVDSDTCTAWQTWSTWSGSL